MAISREQFERIEEYFPRQRESAKISNYTFINAILYMAESGCMWRELPREYGKWSSIYKRFERWVKSGAMQRIFDAMQRERIITIRVEVSAPGDKRREPCAGQSAPAAPDELLPEAQAAAGTLSFTWCPQMTRLISQSAPPAGRAAARLRA